MKYFIIIIIFIYGFIFNIIESKFLHSFIEKSFFNSLIIKLFEIFIVVITVILIKKIKLIER